MKVFNVGFHFSFPRPNRFEGEWLSCFCHQPIGIVLLMSEIVRLRLKLQHQRGKYRLNEELLLRSSKHTANNFKKSSKDIISLLLASQKYR